MNLTSMGLSFTKCTKSTSSSSLKFFIATTFSLIEEKFILRAWSMAEMAFYVVLFLRVIIWFLAGINESKLIFMLSRPAFSKSGNFLLRRAPLVVIPIFSIWGIDFKSDTMSAKSLRTVGSPPVSLILVVPQFSANSFTNFWISYLVSSLSSGVKSIPLSGIQY